MSKNGRRKQPAYSDLSDESTDHEVGPVISDSDSSQGRTRKYMVNPGSRSRSPRLSLPLICRNTSLSRNEIICIVVGVLVFVAILILFVVIGVVTAYSSPPAATNSTAPPPHTTGTPPPPHTTPPPPHTTHSVPTTSPVSTGATPTTSTTAATTSPPMPWDNVRLPSSVTPDTYDVHLTVDLTTFAVTGSVDVSCIVSESTDTVLIHAKEMTIDDGNSFVRLGNRQIGFDGFFSDVNEFYVMRLSEGIPPGHMTVHLTFNYTLSEVLSGFYRSSYTDGSGQSRYLATTQFESTDARKAFPCFDEPALKANFTMHMTHRSDYHAVSNMPAVSREGAGSGMVTTHFETSVKMSSYLVAFIVSDFACMGVNITEGRSQPLQVDVCVCVCVGVCACVWVCEGRVKTSLKHAILSSSNDHSTVTVFVLALWSP